MSRISRRAVVGAIAATPVVGFATIARAANSDMPPLKVVSLKHSYPAGAVVVSTTARRLYFILPDGNKGIEYPVAVGKPEKQWFGERTITGKHVRPAWSPPQEIRDDNPNLPDVIPSGATNNPMGERALTISPGEYAVHGTNRRDSIGKFASYGCIRMFNEDIIDLFERVSVGSPIIVLS